MPVSVIIPAFNAGQHIGEAIHSVVAQTASIAEIIVIDDGSTDDTGKLAREASSTVTLVRQENRGPSAARNRGLRLAQSELVAFLDSDDLWLPTKIARQLEYIGNGTSGVATSFDIVDEAAHTRVACSVEDARLRELRPLDFVVAPRVTPSSLLVDRRVVGDVTFPEGIMSGEDLVYAGLLRAKGPLRSIEDVLVLRRRHASQLTQRPGHFGQGLRDRANWIEHHWQLLDLQSAESAQRHFWEAAADNV
jgi:glycosyltransferase involved in cell wall biosynthesis